MAWDPISRTVPQYVDSNGDPYSGAVLKFYAAGTTTNISAATDSTGATTVASIALNASGYPEVSGNVVIPHLDQAFKVALYPTQAAADADSGAIWNPDNITIGAPTQEWQDLGVTPTFVSTTSFTLSGDETENFHVGRRLKLTDSGGVDYATITASSYSSPNTTVTVEVDGGGVLDSGLSTVLISILSADNSSLPFVTISGEDVTLSGDLILAKTLTQKIGSDIASASALPVNVDGNIFDITGTTDITSIASKGVGSRITLQFDGALTLTHHATDLVLPGGVDIYTTAGDVAEFYEYASGDWRLINYQSASNSEWYTQYIDFTNGDADDTGAWTFDLPGGEGDGYRLFLSRLTCDTASWYPSLRFRRVGDGSVHSGTGGYGASYGAVGGLGSNNNSATRMDISHTAMATNDNYEVVDIKIYTPHGPANNSTNGIGVSVIWDGLYHDVGTGYMRMFGGGALAVSSDGVDQVQVYLGNGSGSFTGGHGMLTRRRDVFRHPF